MKINVDIKLGNKKKQPIDTRLSVPVTQHQRTSIEQIKKTNKEIDVNFIIRQCIDQIIKQCEKLTNQSA